MDTLTHALIGALVGRSIPDNMGVAVRQRTIAGAFSATLPDIDYLTFWLDPLSFLSDWHRGPTHSFVLLPIWAGLLGWICSRLCRQPEAHRRFTLIAALALTSHILTDVITVYGTAVLWPLSDWRPGLGITFVIDPWVMALVVLALGVSLFRGDTRLPPRLGLVLLLCLFGMHGFLQRMAEQIGRDYAIENGVDAASVRAIAQPLSPLHWKIVLIDTRGFRVSHIRLIDRPALPAFLADHLGVAALQQAYRGKSAAVWRPYGLYGPTAGDDGLVDATWQHPLMRRFRRFATWPKLYRIDRAGPGVCVWFTDARFELPSLPPAFRYGLCRSDADAPWQLYRIRRFTDASRTPV